MLESGNHVADYQIVQPLAENQLFETYQVKGPTGESAKLLLIASDQLAEKKARQAFIDQSKILLGQSFPGLCSVQVVVANEENCFCLYPIPSGVALTELLSTEISVRRSLEIVRDLACCVSIPHGSGLWHGSISPATIYLDGDFVILDEFAFASLLRLDFNSGIDPCYSSPELVRGEPLGPASDLYSLGIVLYRLLAGTVPFNQSDPFATAMMHVQDQAAPLSESLSLLQPLIDGLLCAAPGDRWGAEQLVSELDRFLLLPDIDTLSPLGEESSEETDVLLVEAEDPTSIEKLMDSSTLSTRIEERLKERAEILHVSSEETQDATRANTARMSAIGRQDYRKTRRMNLKNKQYQQKTGPSRFPLLIALGVAIGIALYLTLFGPQTASTPVGGALPAALQAGLESGGRQLAEGDLAAAEKTYQTLVDDYALFPQPYNNLAAIYAKRGDLERSRDYLERAMATDESYVTVYQNLGTVYSEMARDSYGRALQFENGQQAVALQVFGGARLLAVNATGSEEKTLQQQVPQPTAAPKPVETAQPPIVSAEPAETATEEEILLPEPASAEDFLRRWAAAWSAQDVEAYLGYYAEEFTPSAGGSREVWATQRKSRLARPKSIDVTLSDFSMVRQADKILQIEVTQSYKSDRYADRTRKLFDLVHDGNDWQIIRERSLGRVR